MKYYTLEEVRIILAARPDLQLIATPTSTPVDAGYVMVNGQLLGRQSQSSPEGDRVPRMDEAIWQISGIPRQIGDKILKNILGPQFEGPPRRRIMVRKD